MGPALPLPGDEPLALQPPEGEAVAARELRRRLLKRGGETVGIAPGPGPRGEEAFDHMSLWAGLRGDDKLCPVGDSVAA